MMNSQKILGALECGVCLEQFRNPKLLPCYHTFCQECLISIEKVKKGKEKQSKVYIRCPTCRKDSKISHVKKLPKNYIVCDILDALSSRLSISDSSQSLNQQPQKPTYIRCTKHKDKALKFFCQTCNCQVCSMCLESNPHDNHSFCLIESQFQHIYQKLHTLLSKADEQKQILQSQLFCLMNIDEEIRENHEQSVVSIQEAFNTLRDDINLKESQLIQMVREKLRIESNHVREVKCFVEGSLTNLIAVLTSTDQMLKESNQYDLIDMHFDLSKELSSQIALGVDFEELLPDCKMISTAEFSVNVETLRDSVINLDLDMNDKDCTQFDQSEHHLYSESEESENCFSEFELHAMEKKYFNDSERTQLKYPKSLNSSIEAEHLLNLDASNGNLQRGTCSTIFSSTSNILSTQGTLRNQTIDNVSDKAHSLTVFNSPICFDLHNKISNECCKVEESLSVNLLKIQDNQQFNPVQGNNTLQETNVLQELLANTSCCKVALRDILGSLDYALSMYQANQNNYNGSSPIVNNKGFQKIIESFLHLILSNVLKISLMVSQSLAFKRCVNCNYGEML